MIEDIKFYIDGYNERHNAELEYFTKYPKRNKLDTETDEDYNMYLTAYIQTFHAYLNSIKKEYLLNIDMDASFFLDSLIYLHNDFKMDETIALAALIKLYKFDAFYYIIDKKNIFAMHIMKPTTYTKIYTLLLKWKIKDKYIRGLLSGKNQT